MEKTPGNTAGLFSAYSPVHNSKEDQKQIDLAKVNVFWQINVDVATI